MTRPGSFTRWLITVAGLAAALGWLLRLGRGVLAAPPLSGEGVRVWLDRTDAASAAFAIVRLFAIAVGVYLLALVVTGGLARLLNAPALHAAVERVTLPFARSLLGGVALLGVMAAPPPPAPSGSDTMVELPPDPSSTTSTTVLTTPQSQATLHLLPTDPAPPVPSTPIATSPDEPDAADGTWVVQAGESFWSIALEHLTDVSGQPVSERDVASYWRQVVERNRSILVNPDDADLLFVDQVVELPAVTSG